jgi:hypothetical protein
LSTLKKAIEVTPGKWLRKRRPQSRTCAAAKRGRKISPITTTILEIRGQDPQLSTADIATELSLPVKRVKDAIWYHYVVKRKGVATGES